VMPTEEDSDCCSDFGDSTQAAAETVQAHATHI